MNVEKAVKNWIESAEYDLETAGNLFQSGRYIYTVFMCHLALEKGLKAKVHQITGKMPPRTHDLEYLMRLSGLSLKEESLRFLAEISNLSVVTRYPEDFKKLVRVFQKSRVEFMLDKTREISEWISKSITL